MISMNAWDKEEMDGDTLDQGNAMSQTSNPLQHCRSIKQKKFAWLISETANFVSEALIKNTASYFLLEKW